MHLVIDWKTRMELLLSCEMQNVNIVCTSLLTGKHKWRISQVAKCKRKTCLAPCAISIALPLSSHGARSVTSLTLYDVSK